MIIHRKHIYKISISLLILLSAGLIAFGSYGLWQFYKATHNPNPQISSDVVTNSTDKPDETPLNSVCQDYKVANDQPRTITVANIGLSACIERVGIDQHNAIAVPTNINLAGWYINSARPGQTGVSIIDGHIMGRYKEAAFTPLKKIKTGDVIEIELGDGSKLKFITRSIDNYSVNDAIAELLKLTEGITKQLNLITCGGNYDAASHSYDKRTIVRAELVD